MNATTHEPPAGAGSSGLLAGTNFRALRKLGEGSMGLVVEAENLSLGTVVVIKLLHAALARRPDYVDRLRLEAQALARLRHPNLIVVSDFSVTAAGVPFLVMERLEGRTVDDERKMRGALHFAEAIDIVQQTLAGLTAVHEAGMVHRDIKAANLFLCDPDKAGRRVVKILDFGIAKVLSTAPPGRAPQPLRFATAEGATVGTPRCLSPEQAYGGAVDARTDIYAVGILLYTLLAGRGPFDHVRSTLELLDAHATLAPPPPSSLAPQHIPATLDAIILRALAKRPEDRFMSAAAFSAALDREARAIAPAARSTSAGPRRFDTEPLAEPDLTIWIPPVPGLAATELAQTTIANRVPDRGTTFNPPVGLSERSTPSVALAVVIVSLCAFGSAALAAVLAWAFLFRR